MKNDSPKVVLLLEHGLGLYYLRTASVNRVSLTCRQIVSVFQYQILTPLHFLPSRLTLLTLTPHTRFFDHHTSVLDFSLKISSTPFTSPLYFSHLYSSLLTLHSSTPHTSFIHASHFLSSLLTTFTINESTHERVARTTEANQSPRCYI